MNIVKDNNNENQMGGNNNQQIYEMFGEFQKYIDLFYPIDHPILKIDTLDISNDSDEEKKETKKIDLQTMPETEGGKQ